MEGPDKGMAPRLDDAARERALNAEPTATYQARPEDQRDGRILTEAEQEELMERRREEFGKFIRLSHWYGMYDDCDLCIQSGGHDIDPEQPPVW